MSSTESSSSHQKKNNKSEEQHVDHDVPSASPSTHATPISSSWRANVSASARTYGGVPSMG
eukprot:CAMPEP_0198712630 /NCGR_PEP_ID=MMETSP1471-20131121/4377_1 /TAXON_ID=41880 /ORGANISM="Pycnococcus provasolii, Strain RCC733" /LENGTH=60 /DNA_ID=CAMNT_0044472617 /DNA_START=169 /DNA_END=351 /DNA_ORIENTATION=-